MDILTPINKIAGVGPFLMKKLKKLGIETVYDLVFYFPRRYEDFSNLVKIADIKINDILTIYGRVKEIENIKTWKKKIILTKALVEDHSGSILVIWFNQPYLIKNIKKDDYVFLSGRAVSDKNGIYLSNPIYEKVDYGQLKDFDSIHTGRLVPIYSETEGLSSRWIRSILKSILTQLKDKIPETLPEKILKENKFLPLQEALFQIHFPKSKELAEMARQRFSFEELFYIQLIVLREKYLLSRQKAISINLDLDLIKDFVYSLPFKLTNAQKKAAWQILKDLQKPVPMNRLLEGDVGSGKTVVAAIAALNTIKNGYQVAFMAPTEILARQHFQEIFRLLKNFNVNIGLLTGKNDKFYSKKLKNDVIEISRNKLLEKVINGEIDILIGTHALIQDKVKFQKLALVILDEQHRFGVEQRAKLLHNSKNIPHLLSMTATPIPRTLALTLYGDLDISIIDELPKGRKKIITKIIDPENRKEAYNFVRKEVENGRQVFIVCPRIEAKNNTENDNKVSLTETKAVKKEFEKLSKEIFLDLKVGMLHGKMTPKEKEKIMKDFKNRKIDILVSTSVIEVGIDVPNATVIIIEGAERFGLAQLHQFRGRVGRGIHQSFCFLFTDSFSKKTMNRLRALINCEDGFALAEKDLEIRGPGDFVGTRQWGVPDLMMDSLKDISLVRKTKEAAKEILENDPNLYNYPLIRNKLNQFKKRIHLE